MDTNYSDPLIRELLQAGVTPARQLRTALNISQPTLSRVARAAGPRVVRIGRGRATRYALAREIGTFGSAWPVYRIGADGHPQFAAHLHALHPRAWWYEPVGTVPTWIHGEFADGLFPDLPWFLDDLRPQGFLGRLFARRYGEALGLSPDPRAWDAAGVLTALLLHGDDLPGNFVIGDQALERVNRAALSPPRGIALAERAARYAELAQATLAGEVPGSSAGGEHPKFTACLDDGGTCRHVLVKFASSCRTVSGRRWADLLVCEHLASKVLREHGVTACNTTCMENDDICYLEVDRFDRVGSGGRHGFVTLMGLDSAYYGKLDSWRAASDRLERDGWLAHDDADMLRLLWWFGQLICNTDMHFGNVSLNLDQTRPLRLAPAYDMLPMHYRPDATGEAAIRSFTPRLPTPLDLPLWRRAADTALVFWNRASQDVRISPEFREEAGRVLDATRSLCDRFG